MKILEIGGNICLASENIEILKENILQMEDKE